MPRFAASDLGLHCLRMSRKKDARRIWVKNHNIEFCYTEKIYSFVNPYKPTKNPFYGTSVNSAEPYQTPQNAASGQVHHYLVIECSIKSAGLMQVFALYIL